MSTEVTHFNKYELHGAYHWEQCSPRERNFNPPLVARYGVVVREVEVRAPIDSVLDIGCGDGYLMAQVSPFANEVHGVDPEEQAVDLAKEMLGGDSKSRVVLGNCYDLPYPDEAFDVVLLADVIEHLKDDDACLREIRRVLRRTGTLVVTTPQWRSDRVWDERHEREYQSSELRDLLSRHFARVDLSFFWPLAWTDFCSTRIGWRACKLFARWGYNPFFREGTTNRPRFGQLKAVCGAPVQK